METKLIILIDELTGRPVSFHKTGTEPKTVKDAQMLISLTEEDINKISEARKQMSKFTEANQKITEARILLHQFISELLSAQGNNKHEFSKDNQPTVIFEEDNGVNQMIVVAVDDDNVCFDDGSDFPMGEMETDQLTIVAQYLEMDLDKK